MPITQTYRILCNNRESLNRHQVIMTHISKEEEHIIDKIVNAHILLIRGDKQFKITKKQIYCYGETKDGNYFIFSFYSWHYFYNEGQREYTHANYVSSYAVNRITQEIIQERVDDDTKPEYIASQEFMDIVGMNYSNVIEKRSYD